MNGANATSCMETSIQKWQLPGQAPGTENLLNDEFMAVFSHELRNSLGAIRNAALVLRRETSADPAAVKARAVIERQVGQMTRLVEDLLDTSRIQRGKLRLQLERVDLCAVVSQCLQTVELAMRERHHRVSAAFPDRPLWVHADSSRLEQVFVNLLLNAAKYTDAGGEIALSVRQQGDEAIIRICDTGIGIAPEILPNVFELFVQADPSHRSADAGLGIGLALVRCLIESHGGCVTVASAGLRQGSEFTVRLPLPAES